MDSLSLLGPPDSFSSDSQKRHSIFYVLRKRRHFGLAVLVAMLALTFAIAFLFPRNYEATMQFMVNNDRVNNPVGSDKNTQAIVYMDQVNETRVNTEVALLTSNDLLLQVVRTLHLGDRISGTHSPSERQQLAMQKLREHLYVAPIRQSAVIDVRYADRNREQAINVLRALSTVYLEAHVRLHGTPGSYQVFEQLWRQAAASRLNAETDLTNFNREHKIVSLPEEKAIALRRAEDLQKQLEDASVAADASNKERTALQQIMTHTPSSIVGERTTIPSQDEVENLNAVLNDLQLKRVDAASRYLPTDRYVTNLDQQIAQTKASIAAASQRNSEQVSVVANPVLRETETELVHVRADQANDREKVLALTNKLATNRNTLVRLDAETAAYNLLTDQVARFTELDHLYRQRADAARMDESLDAHHISDIALSETPFAPLKRSPRLASILAIGVLWSALSALCSMLLLDRARARVRSLIDVERTLGAPVLASIDGACAPPNNPYLPAVYPSMFRVPAKKFWRLA